MYPVLVGGGGIATVLWDFRSIILKKLNPARRRGNNINDSLPISSRRSSSPEQEVDRIERIELPELGSGAEDTIRPVLTTELEQPEPVKHKDGKYSPALLPMKDVERQGVRQRQTGDKQREAFPTTADLQDKPVEVKEQIHTLNVKTAAAIFVLFVALVITFVVLKSTLTSPGRALSLFTK